MEEGDPPFQRQLSRSPAAEPDELPKGALQALCWRPLSRSCGIWEMVQV